MKCRVPTRLTAQPYATTSVFTPITKTGWASGGLAILYAIGVVQYLSPIRFIGMGVPTVVGLLAGVCGLFAVPRPYDHSWAACIVRTRLSP